MRESDTRGRRLAVVSHELMNAHLSDDAASIEALAALEELGYGLMALPPATQPEPLRIEAFDHLVDQLQDYLRHGYAAIVVADDHVGDWMERLDTACRTHHVTPPQRIRVAPDFRAALEAIGPAAR
jgi:hypothetical protein